MVEKRKKGCMGESDIYDSRYLCLCTLFMLSYF